MAAIYNAIYNACPSKGSSFSSSFETGVDCIVADDGEFEFPAEIKSELGAFSSFFTTIKRESLSTYQNGNSVLVVTRSNG